MERIVPDGVVAVREIAKERFDLRALPRRRRLVLLGDLGGSAHDVLDAVLAQAAQQPPPGRGPELREERHRGEPDLAVLLRVEEDLEDAANGPVLPGFVELEQPVNRRDPNLADPLPLQEPFERGDGVGRGEACEATHRDLSHAGIAIEQHGHERLAPPRVLDEREQRHGVRANPIVVSLERLDERRDGVGADDR